MKKIAVSLILTLIVTLSFFTPAKAAPPTYEEWVFAAFDNDLVVVTMTINTVNLKTDHFTCYNNSDYSVYLRVRYNGEIVWDYVVGPHTTQEFKYTVNFQRLPATDPDDPDSIRYPVGYSFGASYPWE